MLDPDHVVTAARWPDAPDSALGTPYPRPYGVPGVGLVAAVPAVVVEEDSGQGAETLLIADGHVAADQVILVYEVDDRVKAYAADVTLTTDGEGSPVSVVDITSGPTGIEDARGYWANFVNGAGALPDAQGLHIAGAGSAAAWALQRSSLPIDWPRMTRAIGELNAYGLSGFVADQVTPTEWVDDRVVGLLPASWARSPRGLYLTVERWDAGPTDAVENLVIGDGRVFRDGPVRWSGRTDRLQVAVRYGYDERRSAFSLVQVARGEGRDVPAPRTITIDATDVYDAATAERLGRYHLWREGQQVDIPVRLAPSMGHLEEGDVVTFTDAELGGVAAGQAFVVRGLRLDPETLWLSATLVPTAP